MPRHNNGLIVTDNVSLTIANLTLTTADYTATIAITVTGGARALTLADVRITGFAVGIVDEAQAAITLNGTTYIEVESICLSLQPASYGGTVTINNPSGR